MRHLLKNMERTRGFTIIEVVIVLAIAGLIFAVVFVAVPQLQAAQRDSARQDAIGRFEAAVVQYQSRNNGELPNNGQSGLNQLRNGNYIDDFADPIGGDYQNSWPPSYEKGHIYYRKGRVCNDPNQWGTSPGGARNYTLRYQLEQGNRQCRDNQ